MRLLLVPALVVLLLSGCSDGGPQAGPAPEAGPSITTTTSGPVAAPPAVYFGTCDVSSGVSYGVAGSSMGSMQAATCPFSSAKEGNLSGLAAAIIEVVWTPGPTVTGAGLLIQSDHCHQQQGVDSTGLHSEMCDYGSVAGASPLRLQVTSDALAAGGGDDMEAIVIPQGASASQAFTIYVTLFEASPPSGYSAIPA